MEVLTNFSCCSNGFRDIAKFYFVPVSSWLTCWILKQCCPTESEAIRADLIQKAAII